MVYNTFITLYNSYISLVAIHAVSVWEFKDYSAPRVLQNKISRSYLDVHQFAPVPATSIEMNIPNIQFMGWLEIARYHNQIAKLKERRLPKVVYNSELASGVRGGRRA